MTIRVVVDSCVAIKWFVAEVDSLLADALVSPGVRICAPDFALVEIANALWKNERLGRIEETATKLAIARLHQVIDDVIPSSGLIVEAADLARSLDHPVYDCLYVAAARKLGAPLVTTDAKLLAKLKAKRDRTAIHLAKWKP